MNKDWNEQLLIHEQSGGGNQAGTFALSRFSFTPFAKAQLAKRLSILPKNYVAIHIRNTDYQTYYSDFLSQIRPRLLRVNVLVCSDSNRCVEDVRAALPDSNVFVISSLNYAQGQPIHSDLSLDPARVNIDMLADLMGLALSRRLLYATTTRGIPSGFSILAESLLRSRELVLQLLGG